MRFAGIEARARSNRKSFYWHTHSTLSSRLSATCCASMGRLSSMMLSCNLQQFRFISSNITGIFRDNRSVRFASSFIMVDLSKCGFGEQATVLRWKLNGDG
jgi:hypothetical protein